VGAISVARELEDLGSRKLHDFLEAATDGHEDILTLLRGPALASSNITVSATGNALSYCAGPDADTEEGLADVDDHAHDFSIFLVLQCLADGSEHGMQPKLVDVDGTLLLELVRPFSTMFVLGILPFGSYSLLEEMVVGLESQLGDRSNIVLVERYVSNMFGLWVGEGGEDTYINTPELLYRLESDDLLEQVIPVIALHQ